MNWYYKILGSHTHVSVFTNGAKCGDLCFRNEEFAQLLKQDETRKVEIRFVSEDERWNPKPTTD